MTKQGTMTKKERFIELRSEGRSYADIAKEIGVSKPTLISWAKDLKVELANARTLRLDALFERFGIAKEKRIEFFGKRLEAILTELDKRDLSTVRTDALLSLALKYGDALKAERQDLILQGEEDSFDMFERRHWPA